MKLSVKERLIAFNVLPSNGGYTDLVIIKDARKMLGLTQKEITDWKVKSEKDGITWDKDKAKEIEVNLSTAEIEKVREGFKKLDDEKKLELEMVDVYKKFMERKIILFLY